MYVDKLIHVFGRNVDKLKNLFGSLFCGKNADRNLKLFKIQINCFEIVY